MGIQLYVPRQGRISACRRRAVCATQSSDTEMEVSLHVLTLPLLNDTAQVFFRTAQTAPWGPSASFDQLPYYVGSASTTPPQGSFIHPSFNGCCRSQGGQCMLRVQRALFDNKTFNVDMTRSMYNPRSYTQSCISAGGREVLCCDGVAKLFKSHAL